MYLLSDPKNKALTSHLRDAEGPRLLFPAAFVAGGDHFCLGIQAAIVRLLKPFRRSDQMGILVFCPLERNTRSRF